MDLWFLLLLAASFGVFAATHLALLVALFRQPPRSRAWLSLLIPLLAPYWGFRTRAVRLTLIWLVSGFTYLISLAAAVR